MTFILECDGCKKKQEAKCNRIGDPCNPINPETNAQWWSRVKNGETIHACSRECMDEGLVWPL